MVEPSKETGEDVGDARMYMDADGNDAVERAVADLGQREHACVFCSYQNNGHAT